MKNDLKVKRHHSQDNIPEDLSPVIVNVAEQERRLQEYHLLGENMQQRRVLDFHIWKIARVK